MTSDRLAWLSAKRPGTFLLLSDLAQTCGRPVQGWLAHMFPLIKHNTRARAWRKQGIQIQLRGRPRVSIKAEVRRPAAIRFPIHFFAFRLLAAMLLIGIHGLN